MPLVLDASYAIALILKEADLGEGPERLATEGAVVPVIWPFEVANALLLASRRGRLPDREPIAVVADLRRIPFRVDEGSADAVWQATMRIAQTHVLTAYDAAYLEVALRIAAPLATLDQRLARAAGAAGVDLVGAAGSPST